MNCWTVHVKNFGKIEEASVEVAPLTLFVGIIIAEKAI